MKLTPQAKPVKIRIKSGGEEHSTLDSLKHNFCVEDISSLLDGRLSRWLLQQNEIELADEVKKVSSLDTIDEYLHFVMLFFENEFTDNSINTLSDLANYWYTTKEYKSNALMLYQYLMQRDIEAAKKVYKENILPDIDWCTVFRQCQDLEQDAEAMYILGKLMYETGKTDEGLGYIDKAARKGNCPEADNFLIEERKKDRFYGVNKEFFTEIIKHRSSIRTSFPWVNTFSGKDKDVALFIHLCKLICSKHSVCNIEYATMENFTSICDKMPHTSFLKTEKTFIIGLIYTKKHNLRKEKELYKSIADCYVPAQKMLSDRDFYIEMSRTPFDKQIDYILNHLFEF